MHDTIAPVTDGRRRRGEDNRRKIVVALMELVKAGHVAPTAEEVAARAIVGLRTVFRHFDDMESLYREIAQEMESTVRPVVAKPFVSDDWRGRLDEIVIRRAAVFERIMPFKIAADYHRHQSPFIRRGQASFARLQRSILKGVLPPEMSTGARFEALDMVMGFDSWRRLRREQKLGIEEARAVMSLAVEALMGKRRL